MAEILDNLTGDKIMIVKCLGVYKCQILTHNRYYGVQIKCTIEQFANNKHLDAANDYFSQGLRYVVGIGDEYSKRGKQICPIILWHVAKTIDITNISKDSELKSCPFCNSPCKKKISELRWPSIVCTNQTCGAFFSFSRYDVVDINNDSFWDETIEKFNTRHKG
jgi:hypothetical protein